jgi:hypothetical protein
MKMQTNILIFSIAALSFISCKKEKPAADQAESGVIGSEWFFPVTASKNTWDVYGTVNGGKYFRTEFAAPDVTQEVIENSVILVYGKLTGYDGNVWLEDHVGLLPTVVYRTSFIASTDEWSVAMSPGRISVRIYNNQNYYPGSQPDPGHSFRYIIIPKSSAVVTGQKPTSQNPLSRYSEQELRSLSYDDICATAGIKK